MTTHGNRKGLDELGHEVLWSSRGQQVMMKWEKQYMEACVDALAILPTDRVLEIGFGLAYSASHIQTFHPKSHTIIECDQETLQRAQQFAERHSGVQIVAGTWQQQLSTLGQFDCVFFDDYPLPELENRNPPVGAGGGQRSRWHDFLDVALKHCATGARISGYLARELDLCRPGCEIVVSKMQVDVPDHCLYFPHKTALVPVITVVDPSTTARAASTDEIPYLLPLPHASKKFQRAFERSEHTNSGFPRERQQIAKIRDFLLAHEMDALSYEQQNDVGDGSGTVDISMPPAAIGYQDEEHGSIHYNDQKSRREFLQTLRRTRPASKQTFG